MSLSQVAPGKKVTFFWGHCVYHIHVFIMVVPIILLYIPISGKRLPEWLIKDLLEKEKIHKKEEFLQGKEVTRAEKIIVPGETVEDFIARKWKKQ